MTLPWISLKERRPRAKRGLGHVPCHPLGLLLGGGSDLAVNVEAGVTPGEDLSGDLSAYEIPGDGKREDLMSEDTGKGGIIEGHAPAEVTIG